MAHGTWPDLGFGLRLLVFGLRLLVLCAHLLPRLLTPGDGQPVLLFIDFVPSSYSIGTSDPLRVSTVV
jgi:hypothetical protein